MMSNNNNNNNNSNNNNNNHHSLSHSHSYNTGTSESNGNDIISQDSSDLLSEGTAYSDEEIDLSPSTTPCKKASNSTNRHSHRHSGNDNNSHSSASRSQLGQQMPQKSEHVPRGQHLKMSTDFFHQYLNDLAGSSSDEEEEDVLHIDSHGDDDDTYTATGDIVLDTISEEEEGIDYENDDDNSHDVVPVVKAGNKQGIEGVQKLEGNTLPVLRQKQDQQPHEQHSFDLNDDVLSFDESAPDLNDSIKYTPTATTITSTCTANTAPTTTSSVFLTKRKVRDFDDYQEQNQDQEAEAEAEQDRGILAHEDNYSNQQQHNQDKRKQQQLSPPNFTIDNENSNKNKYHHDSSDPFITPTSNNITSTVSSSKTHITSSNNNSNNSNSNNPNRRFLPLKNSTKSTNTSGDLATNTTPSTSTHIILDPPQLKSTSDKQNVPTMMNAQQQSYNSGNLPKTSPKLTSPFSPKARRLRTSSHSNNATTPVTRKANHNNHHNLQWSMIPSRKVSILINITPNLNLPISNLEEENSLCLYPGIIIQEPSMLDTSFESITNNNNNHNNTSSSHPNHHHIGNSPARSIKSTYSVTSQASIFYKAPTYPSQEVILVNPKAFGEKIPTSFTIETAKLVASLKDQHGIQSEDWVRKYKFDDICWPNIQQLIGLVKNNTSDVIRDIGNAVVSDVTTTTACADGSGGRCVFSYGMKDSGRLESLFGFIAGSHWNKTWGGIDDGGNSNTDIGLGLGFGSSVSVGMVDNNNNGVDTDWNDTDNVKTHSIASKLGLLGIIVTQLMGMNPDDDYGDGNVCREPTGMKFTLSMIEIAGEDVLRDLLVAPNGSVKSSPHSPTSRLSSPSKKISATLKIRHPDTKGAIVQNCVEETINSIETLEKLIKRAFHSKSVMKARRMDGGRGHVIATLKVYHPSTNVWQEKKVSAKHPTIHGSNCNFVQIQLVDLACAESDQMEHSLSVGHSKIEMKRIQERRTASIRKSMSSLRGILRGLIVNEAQRTSHSMSYRECTLTKLVQRSLDYEGSRAVLIAAACPRQKSYENTLHTLNYMNRLLVKPSKTAESPFETRNETDSFTGPYRSPAGDQSVTSYASSAASETIQTEFKNADVNVKKEFLKSLVSDPRQRLAKLLIKSPTKSKNYTPDLPMKEITTITEIDNLQEDAVEFAPDHIEFNENNLDRIDSENINDISCDFEHNESLDPSIIDQSMDLPSEQLELKRQNENTKSLDESNMSMSNVQEKVTTFDNVLKQLDELGRSDEFHPNNDDESASLSLSDIDYEMNQTESNHNDCVDQANEYMSVENGHSSNDTDKHSSYMSYSRDKSDKYYNSYVSNPTEIMRQNDGDSKSFDSLNNSSFNGEEVNKNKSQSSNILVQVAKADKLPITADRVKNNANITENTNIDDSNVFDHKSFSTEVAHSDSSAESASEQVFRAGWGIVDGNLSQSRIVLRSGREHSPELEKRRQSNSMDQVNAHSFGDIECQDAEIGVSRWLESSQVPERSKGGDDTEQLIESNDECDSELHERTFGSKKVSEPIKIRGKLKTGDSIDRSNANIYRHSDASLYQKRMFEDETSKVTERSKGDNSTEKLIDSNDEFDSKLQESSIASKKENEPIQAQGKITGDDSEEHINAHRYYDREYQNVSIYGDSTVQDIDSKQNYNQVLDTSIDPVSQEHDYNNDDSQAELIEKTLALVQDSNALRVYSPYKDGKPDAKKSLENYKSRLKNALRSLQKDEMMIVTDMLRLNEEKSDLDAKPLESLGMPDDLVYPASDSDSLSGIDTMQLGNDLSVDDMDERDYQYSTNGDEIDKKLKQLDRSIQSFIKSTNEEDLINELAADKLRIDHATNTEGVDHRVKKLSLLTAQTEALQSHLNSTQNQLKKSRAAERKKQQQIVDLQNRMEETQEEILSLKSSNQLTIDQIKQDHIESLQVLKRNSLSSVEKAAHSFKEEIEEISESRRLLEKNHSNEVERLMKVLNSRMRDNKVLEERINVLEQELNNYKTSIEMSSRETFKRENEFQTELAKLPEKNSLLSSLPELKSLRNKKIVDMQEAMIHLELENENLKMTVQALENSNQQKFDELVKQLEKRDLEVIKLVEDSKTLNNKNINFEKEIEVEVHRREEKIRILSSRADSLKLQLDHCYNEKKKLEMDLKNVEDSKTILNDKLSAERERRREVALELARQSKSLEEKLNESNIVTCKLNHDLEKSKQEIITLTDKLIQAESSFKSVSDSLVEISDQKDESIKYLNAKEVEIERLNELLSSEIKEKEEIDIQLKERVEQLEKDLDNVVDEKEVILNDLNAKEVEIERLNELLSSEIKEKEEIDIQLKERVEQLEKDLDNVVGEKEVILNDLNAKQDINSHLNNQLNAKEVEIERLNELLSSEIKEKEEIDIQLKERVEQLEKDLDNVVDDKEVILNDLNAKQDSNTSFNATIFAWTQKLDEMGIKLKHIREQKITDDEQIMTLQNLLESSNDEMTDLRQKLFSETNKKNEAQSLLDTQIAEMNEAFKVFTNEKTKLTTKLELARSQQELMKKKHLEDVSELQSTILSCQSENKKLSDEMNLARDKIVHLEDQQKSEKMALLEEKQLLVMKLSENADKAMQKEDDMFSELNTWKQDAIKWQKLYEANYNKEKDLEVQISCQKEMLKKKNSGIDKLKEELSKVTNEVGTLRDSLDCTVREKEKLVEEHDTKVTSINSSLSILNNTVDSQSEEIASLQEKIQQLYQSLKEEIETKIVIEKAHEEEIASIEATKMASLQERNILVNDLKEARAALESVNNKLKSESDQRQELLDEIKDLRLAVEEKKQCSSQLTRKLHSLQETNTSLISLLESEKKLHNEFGKKMKLGQKERETEKLNLEAEIQKAQETENMLIDELNLLRSEIQDKTKEVETTKKGLKALKEDHDREIKTLNGVKEKELLKMEDEITKLKEALIEGFEKNKKLKVELSKVKSTQTKTAAAVNAELEKTKVLNTALQGALEETKMNLSSQLSQLQEEKDQAIEARELQCENLERNVVDLRMVNDSLNQQNKDLLRRLQENNKQLENANEKKNKMYSSLQESEKKMRAEMMEIQTTMKSAMIRKNKELSNERKKFNSIIDVLETKIKELENENRSYDFTSDLSDQNRRLKNQIAHLEERLNIKDSEIDYMKFDFEPNGMSSHYVSLLRSEKEQRIKAEQFAASMAARAKSGFEDRDEKILVLRMQIAKLEAENKNHKRAVSSVPTLATSGNSLVLKEHSSDRV